jgi:D-3-phosphoglycerate dehydrogenase
MAVKILVSDPLDEAGLELLRREAEVEVKTDLTPPKLVEAIGQYDAIVVRSGTKVTAEVIEAGQRLRVIGRAGVGVDNIDVEKATEWGIIVVNAPTPTVVAVAEHTMALLLATARHVPLADASLREGKWLKKQLKGTTVAGKVLGIVGLGRIGTAVAKRAGAFDMEIIAYDPYLTREQIEGRGATPVASLEKLLERSDFVTLHVTLTPETQGMIGVRELDMMKPTARLINCDRGAVVDEEALLKALKEGRLAAAGLDCFCEEPATDNPLCCHEKVVATPHIAASTVEAQREVSREIAWQVLIALRGNRPQHLVNPKVWASRR